VAVHAYVLIQTDVGHAADVVRQISELEGIVVAEGVTGPYDVIARAEARSIDALGKLVVAGLGGIDGITRTITCPVVHL
jgi:DNA-binding Lrp family transcriptional regulator